MTTPEAIRVLTQEEAVGRLLANGYVRENCAACKGLGHLTIAPDNGDNWQRFVCSRCEGHGVVWKAPLIR